ncbi:MAG: nucleotidyltransferase [Christensenellaceae bacterium]|jgi:cytidyltransferase-like protein
MEITAIIAEYNPLHSGHIYQIEEIKKQTDSKILVIMSGNFVQRGEAAIFDKWKRAKMALLAGADIVLELPTIWATASAKYFAAGAINILNGLDSISFLSFGMEVDSLNVLKELAEILDNPNENFQEQLQKYTKEGHAYPKAQSMVIKDMYGDAYAKTLEMPNNILALEYLAALRASNSKITPLPVTRVGALYHENSFSKAYTSATAIRAALHEKNDAWKAFVPEALQGYYDVPIFEETIFPALLYALRKDSESLLPQTREADAALAARILRTAHEATTYTSFLQSIKTKYYTLARIKRVLINFLLGITKEEEMKIRNELPYARVLGIKKESLDMLRFLHKNTKIPIVTNAKDSDTKSMALDVRASDIYALFEAPIKPAGLDYKTPLITL